MNRQIEHYRTMILAIKFAATTAAFALMLATTPVAATHPSTQPARGTILLGTVCDIDGSSPIATAVVYVSEPRNGDLQGMGKVLFSDVTNHVGAFSIDHYIPTGNYDILVFASNGDIIASQRLAVDHDTKPVTTIQIQAYAGSLEGTLQDASGNPAKGAQVCLESKTDTSKFMATTDNKGHYKFDHVIFGNYVVSVIVGDQNASQQAEEHIKIDSDHVKQDLKLK